MIRPDRLGSLDSNLRNQITRNNIVIRNNDRTINLTSINRPGLGRGFGRNDLLDRRVSLNGLMHHSYANRNVRLNGRFHDWQAWNSNFYWRHNNWHRGYWHTNRWNGFYGRNWWGFGLGLGVGSGWGGGWGGWGGGWNGWGGGWGYPVAVSFGISPWGMNYCGYNFGLYDYYNPYCHQPAVFYGGYTYDYSQPLIVSANYASDPAPVAVPNAAAPQDQPQQAEPDMQLFDQAREQFHNGQFEQALQLTEQQIQKTPKDAILHEFRGLVLFALGQYDNAAAPIYAVLAVGPGWDWSTMNSLYPNVDAYTAQLRRLEDYHRQHRDDAAASFLLGYHYLTCGHNEAAAAQLDNVLRLNPQDIVATRLLQAIGDGSTMDEDEEELPADDAQTTGGVPLIVPELPTLADVPAIKPEEMYGNWTASNAKGKTFLLTLDQDGAFVWKSSDANRAVDQKGVFAVEGETLAMEPDGGGVLVGKVTKPDADTFRFEIVGGLPDDEALVFSRVK